MKSRLFVFMWQGQLTAALAATLLLVTMTFASAQGFDAGTLEQKDVLHNEPDYSPFVDRNIPDQVYWGDTHLHTSYSADADFFGNILDPEKAYRFARLCDWFAGSILVYPADGVVLVDG